MFREAGFEPIQLTCVQSAPIDVSLSPLIVDFDRFTDVVVTSPESATLLIDAVLSRWVQWPSNQRFWSVGPGTAAILEKEIGAVRMASEPGSKPLLNVMLSEINSASRVVVACGRDSGRQFAQLDPTLTEPVRYLELFDLVTQLEPDDQDLANIVAIVHGSAVLLRAFLAIAKSRAINVTGILHFVTSSDAKSQLPAGSRYHLIASPTAEAVELALQGDPSVKD